MHTKKLLAIAVAATLTACGGGDPAPSSATPDAAIRALRVLAQTLADSGIAPEEAARQLLDAAEASPAYRQYFPQHQQTQSLAPFLYRYYPDTGIYLGVVVTGGTPYELGSVYVMGGPFGDAPQNVGPLTSYITPVAPTTGGTAGASNGCFDLDAAFAQGTHTQVTYRYSDSADTQTVDALVGGLTTFEGNAARETTTRTTGSMQGQPFEYVSSTYAARTGDAEVSEYGMVAAASGTMPGSRTVYSPPYKDPSYALAAGQSATVTQSGAYTYAFNGTESSYAFSDSYTITYVGRETVSVPAGTYEACKFETSYGPTVAPATNWFIAGKGIHVKSVNGSQTSEATSVKLNDQPL